MTVKNKMTGPVELAGIQAEFVSVDKAQELTGLSRWTWRNYAYTGKISSSKVGSRLLIPMDEIRRIIREGYRSRGELSAKR